MIAVLSGQLVALPFSAAAQSCKGQGVEGDLSGAADIAVIVGRAAVSCSSQPAVSASDRHLETYFTLEITCSTDRQAAADGVCSATPCPTSYFAIRTAHLPDGRTEPAGFQCVTLDQAVVSPGVTLAQVFEAVRKVKLPGGEIGVEPQVRGWRIWSLSSGWKELTSRRLICRWVGRRCMRSFGWWSTGGALVVGSRW
jgi:hypothetical protein